MGFRYLSCGCTFVAADSRPGQRREGVYIYHAGKKNVKRKEKKEKKEKMSEEGFL